MEKNFIEDNMNSSDSLVRILYSDLNERIQSYTTEGSVAEKFHLIDALVPIGIVGCFALYLVSVVL